MAEATARTTWADWIPLITKLVWPIVVLLAVIVYHREVNELYGLVVQRIRGGSEVEIGGFLKLGEAARQTEVKDLSIRNVPVEAIGGSTDAVAKGSMDKLYRLKNELRRNPATRIDSLIVANDTIFSTNALKQYIAALGLRYVVFQRNGAFDGWIGAASFVGQLRAEDQSMRYDELKGEIVGISGEKLAPTVSAKTALEKMDQLHLESLPVVDERGQLKFFLSREAIVARLMTSILLEEKQGPGASR